MSILPAMSNQLTFFIMTGLLVVLGLISGFTAYYSLKMRHAQHGHDDDH